MALPLQNTCKAVLHNHPKMIPTFSGFILEGVGDILFRLEAQDLDGCRTLPLDSFSLTLADATKLKFNIEWLSAQINFLKALKGNWPTSKRLLSLIHQHQEAFKAHGLAKKEARVPWRILIVL